MNSRTRLTIAIALCATSLAVLAQQPSAAEALFQRALMLEKAEGNVAQAIVLYERVVADYPADRIVVPQALFNLARAYEASDPQRAAKMWSRIVNEYGTTRYADEARRKLAAQQAQAGPFRMRSIDQVMVGQGLDYPNCWDCEVSPSGRAVAWIRLDKAGDKLLIRDVETDKDRTVAGKAGEALRDVDWSPDGQLLSFLVNTKQADKDQGTGPEELRVVAVAAGAARTLVKLDAVGGYWWAPDNKHIILYERKAGEKTRALHLVDVAAGGSKILPGAAPDGQSWSPDGKELAYRDASAQQGDKFFVAAADTGQVRELVMPLKVTGTQDRVNIATGITNDHAFVTRDRILVRQLPSQGPPTFYLVSTNGTTVKKTCTNVPDSRQCGQVTPDGTFQLVEDTANHRLMVIDLMSGTERRLTNGFGDEQSPQLSPDGKLVAYLSNSDGKWAAYVIPVDRGPAYPVRIAILDDRPSGHDVLAWSRDGRLALEVNYNDENIFRINMDRSGHATSPAGRLTQDSMFARSPVASPDSARIAYRFVNSGRPGIAVMTADGAGERPVVEMAGPDHLEWLSADEVLFTKPGAGGAVAAVHALNVKTGETRPYADFTSDFSWQYVPSRNEVVYVPAAAPPASPARTIHARSMKDGADREIVQVDAMSTFRYGFRVSRDGQQLAYGRLLSTGSTRKFEIHVVGIDGRNDRVAFTSAPTESWRPSGTPYDWSPDGRFLLFDNYPGQLMVLDVRSGETWKIAEATDGDQSEWAGAQWSPDGTYIVLSNAGWRAEYKLFEGVTYDAVVKAIGAKK